MPKVFNAAKSDRQLTRFATKPEKGKPFSGNSIERVSIKPGEEAEVEAAFMETGGAKALLECGDLVLSDKKTSGSKSKGKGASGSKDAPERNDGAE